MLITRIRIRLVLVGLVAVAVLGTGAGSTLGQHGSGGDADGLSVAALVASSTTTQPAPTTTTHVSPSTTSVTTTTTQVPNATTTTTHVLPTTTSVATTTTLAPSGSFNAAHESQFLSLINGTRSTSLLSDPSLKIFARNWARHMAETDILSHSNIGSLLDPWNTVGENVAFGHSVLSMFEALSASSAHRRNMVSESFSHVGVGVWIDADGQSWTTHVFGG
ncbi:MAG: hypothetical protein DRJ28_01170 [Actinobacteria bacterium]|nr:MAG: hypothetical protein DRJ28_01170 [Actinomycetota bacterium]